MIVQERKRVAFLMRILNVFAFSCMALFMAIVVVENTEISKILPASIPRTMAVLLAYIVAIFTFNYTLAVRGRNLLDWRTEFYVVVGLACGLAAIFLAFALPASVKQDGWYIPFISSPNVVSQPNLMFLLLLIPAVGLFLMAWRRARLHTLWLSRESDPGLGG